MKEFDCITCGTTVKIGEGEAGIHYLVLKDGGRFWACSDSCAAHARDDTELHHEGVRGKPLEGVGGRPGEGRGNSEAPRDVLDRLGEIGIL